MYILQCCYRSKDKSSWYTLPVFSNDIVTYMSTEEDGITPPTTIMNKVVNQIFNHLKTNHILPEDP